MKAIKSEKKLLKKQKELEKTKQQIAQVETELKNNESEITKEGNATALAGKGAPLDQYKYQPVYENDDAKYDAARASKKSSLNKAFDDIHKQKTDAEIIKRQILDTKLETARTRIRYAAPAPFSNPETNHHPNAATKTIDARDAELENLDNRLRKAVDSQKGLKEDNSALKSALDEQQKLLKETRVNVTAEIKKEKEIEALKLKKEQELSLVQNDMTAEKNQESVLHNQLESAHSEIKALNEKYDKLRTQHDSEVSQLFENKHTLKFVKQMKHYKDEWWNKTGDDDRKKIATQMASTTKSWVSASKEQIAAEEKQQQQ